MMRLIKICLSIVLLGALSGTAQAKSFFPDFCANKYISDSVCPEICQLQCFDGSPAPALVPQPANETAVPSCPLVCIPKICAKISIANCPKDFCQVLTDCANQPSCQPKSADGEIPSCGGLAYSGQDAKCCEGLVKRCGFDYLDGSCNMEGKNTAYNFPICIPCGDGVCSNFENHCNCPEDCKKEIIPL